MSAKCDSEEELLHGQLSFDVLQDFSLDELAMALNGNVKGEISLWDAGQGLGDSSFPCSSSTITISSSMPSFMLLKDEPVGSEVNLQPVKKRRKKYRQNESLFPRILKSDLRRMIHTMYFNVVNSGDMGLYRQFLYDFCVDSCCLLDNVDDRSISLVLQTVKPIKIQNLTNIADIMCKRLGSLPDLVGHLDRSFIRRQLNTPGCLLIAKSRYKGSFPSSKVVRLSLQNGEQHELPYFVVDALKSSGRFDTFVGGCSDVEIETLDGAMYWYTVETETWMIFHLDNDNRIYRIEFHGHLNNRIEKH
eukprot:scaffold2831_cov249-Ochromonas_danica.AAC.30